MGRRIDDDGGGVGDVMMMEEWRDMEGMEDDAMQAHKSSLRSALTARFRYKLGLE